MTFRFLLFLLTWGALASSAAPAPMEEEAEKLRRLYGTWTDPDKDCRFMLKEGTLRISVPAADHFLGTERPSAKNNAPRVLNEVEGDFTAVVRVTFPVPEKVPERFWPYCSGGLVAWESEKAYLFVRRSGGEANGLRESVWCHQVLGTENSLRWKGLGKPGESAFLRLKRDGNKVVAGWSRDGKAWKDFEAAEVAWGAKVRVGVAAENCLGMPVEITFDEYSLTQPKK
jgi:regulation of enolase protein 1 (concanavalin A-like superfamily)